MTYPTPHLRFPILLGRCLRGVSLAGLVAAAAVSAETPASPPPGPAGDWLPLYRGSLDDFRIYFRGQGFIDDVHQQDVFRAEPGQIHVIKGTNGLIVTKSAYSHYHVKVDYRWGAGNGSMNAGLMTHIDLTSKVVKDNRPRSIEINMKADSPGSIWLAGNLGPFGSTFVAKGTRNYLPEEDGGVAHDATPFGDRTVFCRYPGGTVNTRPHGEWNTLEAIVRGADSVEIILNGHTVNRLYRIRLPQEGAKEPGAPLAEGGIGLQSEGQEVFYRNFMIRKLDPNARTR
ncbi:MAG: DUF1080 domain-containing protein [Akkermansiaceae bacterium]|nr:DUF1080 domain-containing protein [Akkermansiaceae bacterium]